MSIKPAGKGKWLVRVARVNQRTGRRENRKVTVVGTKAEAERVERDLESELKAGVVKPRRVQLKTYASEWLESRAESLKPSVRAKYATSLDLHILPALGDFYLDSIRPSDVTAYLGARLAVAAGNTVLNELRCLRTIAADSVAEGLSPAYWCDRVKQPEVEGYTEEDPNLLRPDQLQALIEAIPRRWLGVTVLMAMTGLRWGEASALRWEDIESCQVDGQTLWSVRVRRGNWKGEVVTPKTKKSVRAIPLASMVVPLLGPRQSKGYLFPNRDGGLYRGSPLRAVLDRAAVQLGWARWEGDRKDRKAVGFRITPHGLRRTFNDLARRVASREVVKAVTGHATDAMLEHYSVVDMGEKVAAVDAVVALLAPPPSKAATISVPAVSPGTAGGDGNSDNSS